MLKEYPMSQLIKERRSIRKFKSDKVSNEVLEELLEVATYAPNHRLTQPWRFIIYKDEGSKVFANIMAETMANGPKKISPEEVRVKCESIPAHILVVINEEANYYKREEDYAATCALIQNFQLAAWERGLGVLWKTDAFIDAPTFRNGLGVKPGEKVAALLQVGYPEIVPKVVERANISERIKLVDKNI